MSVSAACILAEEERDSEILRENRHEKLRPPLNLCLLPKRERILSAGWIWRRDGAKVQVGLGTLMTRSGMFGLVLQNMYHTVEWSTLVW